MRSVLHRLSWTKRNRNIDVLHRPRRHFKIVTQRSGCIAKVIVDRCLWREIARLQVGGDDALGKGCGTELAGRCERNDRPTVIDPYPVLATGKCPDRADATEVFECLPRRGTWNGRSATKKRTWRAWVLVFSRRYHIYNTGLPASSTAQTRVVNPMLPRRHRDDGSGRYPCANVCVGEASAQVSSVPSTNTNGSREKCPWSTSSMPSSFSRA